MKDFKVDLTEFDLKIDIIQKELKDLRYLKFKEFEDGMKKASICAHQNKIKAYKKLQDQITKSGFPEYNAEDGSDGAS